ATRGGDVVDQAASSETRLSDSREARSSRSTGPLGWVADPTRRGCVPRRHQRTQRRGPRHRSTPLGRFRDRPAPPLPSPEGGPARLRIERGRILLQRLLSRGGHSDLRLTCCVPIEPCPPESPRTVGPGGKLEPIVFYPVHGM